MIIPRNLSSCTGVMRELFLNMFISEELVCLRWGWKMMNLDLAAWTVSLLALNQEETWESSTLRMVAKVARSSWRRKILVSSAKRMIDERLETWKRSLMYIKRKGPRTEPWGTPQTTELYEEVWSWTMTHCCLHSRTLSPGVLGQGGDQSLLESEEEASTKNKKTRT